MSSLSNTLEPPQQLISGRRWRAFKQDKISVVSLIILLLMCFVSFTSEIWANNKPLYMNLNGKSYFPVFKKYHPSEFGLENDFKSDYREIAKNADTVVWPLIQWSPNESNQVPKVFPSAPSASNYFGTDDRGRDVLTRILYGFRYSLVYALSVWIISTFVAILIGGAMGFYTSWLDLVGQRIIEILETIPTLMILLILVSIFAPTLAWLVLISCFFGWMGLARYVRAEFLRLRKMPFVEFAQAQGTSNWRIIFVHILPNALTPVITFAPFLIAGDIYSLSALDYLGFGLPPPTPSWGEMLSQAKANITIAWWLAVFPSLALFFTLLLLTMLGTGLRRAFDPRTNS